MQTSTSTCKQSTALVAETPQVPAGSLSIRLTGSLQLHYAFQAAGSSQNAADCSFGAV